VTPRGAAGITLLLALLALAALYAVWFIEDRHWLATQLVFTLPPLLLATALLLGWRKAAYWSSVLALAWFSHGVMSAWSHPGTRLLALLEVALALGVIGAASLPGIRARFRRSGR